MSSSYKENYTVRVTKTARRQGGKLGLTNASKLEIIREVKTLKYWPDIREQFEYEMIGPVFEFKFDFVENKWIRVFCYPDEERKIMWVIKVLAKKTNALSKADHISIKTAVSRMKQDIENFKKETLHKASTEKMSVIKGGKDE